MALKSSRKHWKGYSINLRDRDSGIILTHAVEGCLRAHGMKTETIFADSLCGQSGMVRAYGSERDQDPREPRWL